MESIGILVLEEIKTFLQVANAFKIFENSITYFHYLWTATAATYDRRKVKEYTKLQQQKRKKTSPGQKIKQQQQKKKKIKKKKNTI